MGAVVLALPGLAAASPAVVGWSTYLRAGPAETAAAISELEHDTPVKLLGCDAGWCHVAIGSVDGYVDRDALALPRTLAPSPPARRNCVTVGQADNRGEIATRFCPAAPAGG